TLGLKESQPLVVRPTDDLEAYQLYLRGLEAARQRTPSSFRRGLDLFRKALARDAAYARAYVGIAEAYNSLGAYQYAPPDECRREAEAALAQAQRLRPDMGLLYAIRGQLKLYLGPDWPTAGEDLALALSLDPGDATARAYLAFWHGMRGEWDLCVREARQAI